MAVRVNGKEHDLSDDKQISVFRSWRVQSARRVFSVTERSRNRARPLEMTVPVKSTHVSYMSMPGTYLLRQVLLGHRIGILLSAKSQSTSNYCKRAWCLKHSKQVLSDLLEVT